MVFDQTESEKGKNILIIEDDSHFCITLAKSLTQMGHRPVCAENVAHAKIGRASCRERVYVLV